MTASAQQSDLSNASNQRAACVFLRAYGNVCELKTYLFKTFPFMERLKCRRRHRGRRLRRWLAVTINVIGAGWTGGPGVFFSLSVIHAHKHACFSTAIYSERICVYGLFIVRSSGHETHKRFWYTYVFECIVHYVSIFTCVLFACVFDVCTCMVYVYTYSKEQHLSTILSYSRE